MKRAGFLRAAGGFPWGRLLSGSRCPGLSWVSRACLCPQIENASEVLITPLEKFRKEQIGAAKVSCCCTELPSPPGALRGFRSSTRSCVAMATLVAGSWHAAGMGAVGHGRGRR